jgi:hypothetical protein
MLDEALPLAEVHGEFVSAAITLMPSASLRATFSHLEWWRVLAAVHWRRSLPSKDEPWFATEIEECLTEVYNLLKDARNLLLGACGNKDFDTRELLSDLDDFSSRITSKLLLK